MEYIQNDDGTVTQISNVEVKIDTEQRKQQLRDDIEQKQRIADLMVEDVATMREELRSLEELAPLNDKMIDHS